MTRSYEPLRSVEKTLLVLEALNRAASCRIGELRAATGLAAPTLVRIMETLSHLGYVRKISRFSGYCLTEKVHGLSAGFHGLPKLFDVTKRMADDFTQDLLWPTSIATFDVDAMVVRYSTIPRSPVSHKHSTINHRLNMLSRAHGRAYLAFCTPHERDHIYGVLVRCGQYYGTTRALTQHMEPLLGRIRRQGVARRDPSLEPDTSSLAVPLWDGTKLVATLGATFFTGSVRDVSQISTRLRTISAACQERFGTGGLSEPSSPSAGNRSAVQKDGLAAFAVGSPSVPRTTSPSLDGDDLQPDS